MYCQVQYSLVHAFFLSFLIVSTVFLQLNTAITSLDLHDNALEADGGIYIADMLKENCFLNELVSMNAPIAMSLGINTILS
jgi:hypothetical protein